MMFKTLFALSAIIAVSSAAFSLCPILQGLEKLLEPGFENKFDSVCIPQITQQVDICKGGIQGEAAAMAKELCSTVCNDVSKIAGKFVGSCDQSNPGEVLQMCDTDVISLLEGEVAKECAAYKNINPTQVCQNAWTQLYTKITSQINKLACKSN